MASPSHEQARAYTRDRPTGHEPVPRRNRVRLAGDRSPGARPPDPGGRYFSRAELLRPGQSTPPPASCLSSDRQDPPLPSLAAHRVRLARHERGPPAAPPGVPSFLRCGDLNLLPVSMQRAEKLRSDLSAAFLPMLSTPCRPPSSLVQQRCFEVGRYIAVSSLRRRGAQSSA